MNEMIDQLILELREKNPNLTEEKARTWIELLVSDFESSYAKAGYDYQGSAVVEKVIRQWITSYGDKIHEFAGRNPKYAHLLNEQNN
ncbi:YfhJ family protein [Planococcus shenhongbingii]|uniref:YfhJ family protein n=1 Tax=Planococcus shenhongbingii TaxID=3058398 RepID=A0ABT8NHT7_9BACL|nr:MULTISPECIES: YfhJ family protein [unclassified Planococcus (in: firmicutes)]MDN7247453.1 YfhJ family protein [Planococcus sp. N017]WKA59581.1 YfhJ family protein [Planococcus sp. N016]